MKRVLMTPGYKYLTESPQDTEMFSCIEKSVVDTQNYIKYNSNYSEHFDGLYTDEIYIL